MSKEGIPTIIGLATFAIILGYVGFTFHNPIIKALFVINLALVALVLYFFRDPLRVPPADAKAIISPADGKVIDILDSTEPLYIEGPAQKISIFMTVFDVHVNYVPFNGTVDFLRYNRGSYFRADTDAASTHNVNCVTGLETTYGKLAFKQATGMVARRIVNHLKYGQNVKTGEKFGIIKFGSRVEVFLPDWANITIKEGDRLRAGESVIARVHEK